MLKMIIRYTPLIVIMTVIFLLSHSPGDELPSLHFYGYDKLCHFLAYSTLAAAAIFAFRPRKLAGFSKVFLFCLLYAISDEIHQSVIPNRYPSIADIVADSFGALTVIYGRYRLRA